MIILLRGADTDTRLAITTLRSQTEAEFRNIRSAPGNFLLESNRSLDLTPYSTGVLENGQTLTHPSVDAVYHFEEYPWEWLLSEDGMGNSVEAMAWDQSGN
jgi:hypothetical protein